MDIECVAVADERHQKRAIDWLRSAVSPNPDVDELLAHHLRERGIGADDADALRIAQTIWLHWAAGGGTVSDVVRQRARKLVDKRQLLRRAPEPLPAIADSREELERVLRVMPPVVTDETLTISPPRPGASGSPAAVVASASPPRDWRRQEGS